MVGRVCIRVASLDDVVRISYLNRALFREDAGRRDPFVDQGWPVKHGEGYFTAFLGQENSLCLVAEFREEIAGYLAGYVGDGTDLRPVAMAELESMYFAERYRCVGIGARMVRGFLEWAGEARLASVTAYAANESAIRFYEKIGFRSRSIVMERDSR